MKLRINSKAIRRATTLRSSKKTKIAEHKDINDKGQTDKITEPGTPVDSPDTGDENKLYLFIALMGIAITGITAFAVKETREKIRQRQEDREMLA